MRVNVLSRREIEGVEWFYCPTAVISITDPTAPGYTDDGNEAKVATRNRAALLRLRFWDCDPDALKRNFDAWSKTAETWDVELTARYIDQQLAMAMTDDHARQIRDFVEAHGHLDSLVIHCEAGISRSAGVAAGLCASDPRFTWENETKWAFRPNAHVKTLVARAFQARPAPGGAERERGGGS
jgi:predicted protein tyrosine phosphatase